MSCVAPLKATTAKTATVTEKNDGRCNDKAAKPNKTPLRSCVATTQNFFVRYNSRKGLHRNLIVQGHMISDVQNAICASEMPRSLNKTAETMFSTTNGRPIAKYKLGTQRRGERN